MADTIDVGKLAETVAAMLEVYKDMTDEALAAAVKQTAAETVTKLQGDPTPVGGRAKSYRKSWKSRISTKSGRVEGVVYSSQASLTHLLEFGHAKVGKKGGRTKAIPHIKPAEEFAINRVEQLIREGVAKV